LPYCIRQHGDHRGQQHDMFRSKAVEMTVGRAVAGMRQDVPGKHNQACGCAAHSMPSVSMNWTMVSRPWPVFRLENTNGRAPRIFFASCAITSSDAPTMGARSILLITSRSDLTMPGPPLRGILSPAATSITYSVRSDNSGLKVAARLSPPD